MIAGELLPAAFKDYTTLYFYFEGVGPAGAREPPDLCPVLLRLDEVAGADPCHP